MTVPFELGEQKHVRLRVCSCKNENFLITAASYELYYRGAKEPEDTGHPEIQEHILDTLIRCLTEHYRPFFERHVAE